MGLATKGSPFSPLPWGKGRGVGGRGESGVGVAEDWSPALKDRSSVGMGTVDASGFVYILGLRIQARVCTGAGRERKGSL